MRMRAHARSSRVVRVLRDPGREPVSCGGARVYIVFLVHSRFRTRSIKPSAPGLNLVTKCKSITWWRRYELGVLPMESKTHLLMLEMFT